MDLLGDIIIQMSVVVAFVKEIWISVCKLDILLFNLDGNLLHSKEVILNPLKRSYQIPVDHYPPGLYFIRVISGERIENLKLLKR